MYCDEKTGQISFIEPSVEFNKETRLWREFLSFHESNPHVYEQYKNETIEAIANGREAYSSKLITEHNRWDRKFKISNNHTAYYARIFIEENPQYENFFRLRPIRRE